MVSSDSTTKCCAKGERCLNPYPDAPVLPSTAEFFSTDKNRKDGLYPYCKVCARAEYHAKKEQRKGQRQAYRDANKEHARQKTQEWRENNRERDRANALRWRKENPDKFKTYRQSAEYKPIRVAASHRQRARLKNLPCSFTRNDWRFALDYFGHKCAVCGRSAGLWHTLAADHWIPIASTECPGTVPTNIVPLCDSAKDGTGTCNEEKRDKYPADWLTEKYGKRKAKQIIARIEAYFDYIKSLEDKAG